MYLVAYQVTQMEVKFIKIQVEYHEDGRFQSHGLPSWPRKYKMFLNSLPKMHETGNVD
jgi:hypothetical protein